MNKKEAMDKNTAIVTAAAWWAGKVTKKVHHDNGGTDEGSKVAMMLADMLAKPADKDRGMAFLMSLASKIEQEMGGRSYLDLQVDYHPDAILAEAADEAGISGLAFPFKHFMRIELSREPGCEGYVVEVQEGYGAKWRKLDPITEA